MPCSLIGDLIIETPMVLASASPRRKVILEGLGLEFLTRPTDVAETRLAAETPEEHVVRLADAKSSAAACELVAGTVLGADTIVLLDDALLGKPEDEIEARRMLRAISGRWHEVLTGVCVIRASDGSRESGFERTRVLVRELTDDQISRYVAGGEPMDKAGSYAIQGCGSALVERVEGCFYNVVGLPVVLTTRLLARLAEGRAAGPAPV